MNDNWGIWGDDIRRTVQRSIDSHDYSKLNESITRIVDMAIDSVHDGLRTASDTVEESLRNAQNEQARREQARKARNKQAHRAQAEQTAIKIRPKLYANPTKLKSKGVLMMVFGIAGILVFSGNVLGSVLSILLGGSLWIGELIGVGILLVLFAACILLAVRGFANMELVNRFRSYVKIIGNKAAISVDDLASIAGKSVDYMQNDLKKMMKKGLFLQGHMEEDNTYLIVSDEHYKEYQQAKLEYQLQEEKRKKAAGEVNALPENVRQIIAEGEEFIRKIHASNDAIPGEEISEKIDHMENIVRKIFQRIKQKPELVNDVKKLMSYYLPTTIKLLEAYEEMDAQPIQGPNIINSKQEIEKTIGTLNVAFEKMLDDFYQETAWDISSDISVLETMLAQEGLTKSEFEK